MLTSAAWVLFRQGRLPEAVARLRQAADRDASSPKPHLALAEVLEAAGDRAGARSALDGALERQERPGEAHMALALFLLRGDGACEAAGLLSELIASDDEALRSAAGRELPGAQRQCRQAGG